MSNANGEYSFENLSPDTYTVAEVQQPGWTQTSPFLGTISEVFNADFSNAGGNPNLDGFTVDNTGGAVAGLWHLSTGRGNQSGHSANDSLYFGTGEGVNGGGNYDVGHTAGRITSPVIDLTAIGSAELSFNYFLVSEGVNPFDSARVLISKDGGVFESVASNVSELVDPTTGWTNATIDLTPYTGSNIEIRFDFDTIDDFANNFEGWYVDDINVTEVGKGTHTLELAPDETATDIDFGNHLQSNEGTPGDDILTGTPEADELEGFGGNDRLSGLADRDTLKGGSGNDTVFGGNGDDVIVGQNDNDYLYGGKGNDGVRGNTGDDLVVGGKGSDRVYGGQGMDTLIGVAPDASQPGVGEIDLLHGVEGGDRFVLGDASKVYYDDGDNATSGLSDYGSIEDFVLGQNVIQLSGNASDYVLATSPSGLPSGTAIFLETGTTDELIGIVRNVPLAQLNLTGSSFSYV